MFKNLILLVLIALLAIPAVTGCSKATEEAAPPASAAAEEKPANPTSSPTPATTPPEKISEKEDPEKAISVSEFIKRALNNKYKKGDIVFISGVAETDGKKKVDLYNVGFGGDTNDIIVGPETSGYIVKVSSEEIKTADYPKSEQAALASFMSVAEVKVGDEITIKGTYGWHTKSPSPAVVVIDATVQ